MTLFETFYDDCVIGVERIFSQRVRVGLGVQLLQGLHRGRRDLPGGGDSRNFAKQNYTPATNAHYTRVIFKTDQGKVLEEKFKIFRKKISKISKKKNCNFF